MKILSTVAVATLAGTLPAAASDNFRARARMDQPGYETVQSWTGLYVGVNAGYTIAGGDSAGFTGTDTGGDGIGTALALGRIPRQIGLQPGGFIGGAQAGYNWQSGAMVYGLEADIQGVAGRDSFSIVPLPPTTPATISGSQGLEWLATLRGRLGVTATPELLLYVTGGLAVGQTKLSFSALGPGWAPTLASVAVSDPIKAGWTIGAGAEWALAGSWSVKGEYLYYDLGSSDATVRYDYVGETSTLTAHTNDNGHIVRVGLNYKIGH